MRRDRGSQRPAPHVAIDPTPSNVTTRRRAKAHAGRFLAVMSARLLPVYREREKHISRRAVVPIGERGGGLALSCMRWRRGGRRLRAPPRRRPQRTCWTRTQFRVDDSVSGFDDCSSGREESSRTARYFVVSSSSYSAPLFCSLRRQANSKSPEDPPRRCVSWFP